MQGGVSRGYPSLREGALRPPVPDLQGGGQAVLPLRVGALRPLVPKVQVSVSRATRPYGREVWRDGVVRNRRVIVLGWGWGWGWAMRLDCVH